LLTTHPQINYMLSAIIKCEKGLLQVKKWMKLFGIHEKSYQERAMRWAILKELGYCETETGCVKTGQSGLIADEMGLGKTIMMLGTWVGNFKKNTLIVVPSALLSQWDALIYKWLGFQPLVYHGHGAKTPIKEIKNNYIVLTTYGMISTRKNPRHSRKWSSPLWDIEWDRIMYDEAHHLRNEKSNKHKGAAKLQSKCQWFMTGTPIQNSEKDLVSLCKLMGIWDEIRENPEDVVKILKPYVMMRSKKDVGLKLAPYEEEIIKIIDYDSKEERELLREIHSKLGFTNVTVENVNEVIGFLSGESHLPMLTRARQACVCPGIITKHLETLKSNGIIPLKYDTIKNETNTKIRKICEKIIQEKKMGNNSLVFCHYIQEMEIINKTLENLSVEMLNGNTTMKNRKIIPTLTPDVLMVQVQSCCEGLNLQQFSCVFFTSPHWNPAVEDQAIARAHRIGQKKKVKVYKYIAAGLGATGGDAGTLSLDQYCVNIQEKKREAMKKFQKDNKRVMMPE
jgi:SNF2 family DNA or RNA helicase